ncbi:MAG TPA: CHASE3 domain-containing protein [Polyangiaceae bacterium]|nr:CHASE3 domain-containing protein [Polyangiaceae bacterium]
MALPAGKEQRRLPFGILAIFSVAALMLVATLGLSIVMSSRFAKSTARVDHTMSVKVAAAALLETFFEAESGQRGYVLTGRPEYLEPYRRARSVAAERLQGLRELTSANPAQRALVAEVTDLTALRLEELGHGIERRDRVGPDAARKLIDMDSGLHTMEALEARLDELNRIEDSVLAVGRQRQRRSQSLVLASLDVAGIAFGLFLGLFVLWTRAAEARRQSAESEATRLRSEKDVLAERQRTAEFQERFIAILGHDLRTPLSSVTMGIDLLRRTAAGRTQATLDRITSSAARMSRMIDQLLDLTRSRLGGGIAIDPVPMNLEKLVAEVLDEARAAHPERMLLFEVAGDLHGRWDPDRLAQVLSNLVGNALVHGSRDTPVRVAARGENDTVEIAVSNHGPAISDSVRQVLFDPFRRGQQATSRTSGLGLGLYITREIVVAHGGSIDVVSTDGDGTKFRVRLARGTTAPPSGAPYAPIGCA